MGHNQIIPVTSASTNQARTDRDPATTASIEPRQSAIFSSVPEWPRAIEGESSDALTSVDLMLTRLRSASVWREAASTVALLLWDSTLAGTIGWFANYLYTFGNVFSGESPATQSYAEFCAGVMALSSVLIACSNCVVQSASMLRLHFLSDPNRHPTLRECIGRLVSRTWKVMHVTLVLAAGTAYAMASLPAATHPFKLHFYVTSLVININTVHLDLVYRRTYQLETVEGQARQRRQRGGGQPSYWRFAFRLLLKDSLLIMTVYVGALYVQISSALRLTTGTELFVFTVASYVFKKVTQRSTKAFILKQKKTHTKTIYLAVAVPTVLIDTQIRVVILRQANVRYSIVGTVAISAVEIVFRFVKVWFLRVGIARREKRVTARILQHASTTGLDTTPHPRVPDHPQYHEFVQWRRCLLRFHAAEIHADMCAEYLAIVCSMSIVFFFHKHPKYLWSTASTTLETKGQVVYLAVQVMLEMLVDFCGCLWELVNGVPLHQSKDMREFISALFTCCSMTNILLSAAISVKNDITR